MFSLYGFHWRLDDAWISSRLAGDAVQPVVYEIWRDYLAPLGTNVLRFHIDIYAYADSRDGSAGGSGGTSIHRMINLCRFAREHSIKLIPIFAGSGRYRRGKDQEFSDKTVQFISSFLRTLHNRGEAALYHYLAAWQLEDEMNHFIRHAGWEESTYTAMLLRTAQGIERAEIEHHAPCHVRRMVIFPADMMFFKAFLRHPWQYVRSMLRDRRYDYAPPADLQAFAASKDVEIIGVDMYPGLYSPLADVETFLWLVQCLCETYGLGTNYGKQILVAEAGYPTWPTSRRREERQLRFYQRLLTGLIHYYHSEGGREHGLQGILWYCFNDQHIRMVPWPPQEWRFGVVKTIPSNEWFATYPSDPKLAWYWLRDLARSDRQE